MHPLPMYSEVYNSIDNYDEHIETQEDSVGDLFLYSNAIPNTAAHISINTVNVNRQLIKTF